MKELLLLVRSALENRPLEGPVFEQLCQWTTADWDRILRQAQVQSVIGLVYQAVSLLPPDGNVPEEVVFTLVAEGEALAARSRTQDAVAKFCLEEMRQHGLHPLVMKGSETARFYPEPLLRGYGDIDLIIPAKEANLVVSWARDAGYAVQLEADGSSHFEYAGIEVDVHTRYYDLIAPTAQMPDPFSPEGTLLMLSCHALKHAIGAGIGLRQVCDIRVALRALDGHYDPETYLKACRNLGILRWAKLLCRFLDVYLGLPDKLFPGNRVSPEPLMDLIRKGGNFGHYSPYREASLQQQSSFQRKLDTALRHVRRLPFSFRYAPRMALERIWELVCGNLRLGMGRPS